MASSCGEPIEGTEREHTLLFNKTQISVDEVNKLIDEDRWEYDLRVLEVSPQQLKFLQDKR
jgi:hypothetical protein